MRRAPRIRVIIADDHHLVRQGIRSLLEKAGDIEVISEAADGQEAVELVERLALDVLVTDIAMPRLDGNQAVERVRALDVAVTGTAYSRPQKGGLFTPKGRVIPHRQAVWFVS
jgi:DNA-binding NarL/FixJ family response regulator